MTTNKEPVNSPVAANHSGAAGDGRYGQYVEGDYGRAGIEPGRHLGDEDGQYIEGDYGRAGTEPGLHDPWGMHPGEGSGYVTGNDKTTKVRHASQERQTVGNYTDIDPARPHRAGTSRKTKTQQ